MYKTIHGTFNGDSWEEFCQLCFKLKYEDAGYQEMPAWQGDLGIEGFTRTGIVFQCYCPDFDYPPDQLYEKQRDKITGDLNKLITYEKELSSYLKDIKIVKWIFVTPGYKKKELVKHCQEKAYEYRAKNSPILDATFDVLVQDIDFYSEQIPIVLSFRQQKLDIEPKNRKTVKEIADWKDQEISLVNNAVRKNKQRIPDSASNIDDKTNKLTQKSISDFLNGDSMIRQWAEKYQDQYEKFLSTISLMEERVEEKCAVNDKSPNELYKEIEVELRERLKLNFEFLDENMIDRLTNRVMADWILRCPIEF